ncbi:hypothetical protein BGX28_002236, partial [Mortierella sp. GBA30]
MKQYKWKPWTKAPENPLDPNANILKKEARTSGTDMGNNRRQVTNKTRKAELVKAMQWEHPTVTLDVGTVSANLKRALGESELLPEVEKCLRDIVRVASDTKRA